eukprot:TRINITY_DN11581_c0_g2_i1.p1 TRINITY_DN11581_c0_g2~~TRINITY_DN11581_c0_g2_i1.p1  ORF type:complete len:603 (-),score=130.43 TRINITY_DN11581_c0_g2_i1:25-1833(-)
MKLSKVLLGIAAALLMIFAYSTFSTPAVHLHTLQDINSEQLQPDELELEDEVEHAQPELPTSGGLHKRFRDGTKDRKRSQPEAKQSSPVSNKAQQRIVDVDQLQPHAKRSDNAGSLEIGDVAVFAKRFKRDAPTECDRQLGFGLLDSWNKRAAVYCKAPSQETATTLTCRSTIHEHLREPTRPHTQCDARNLVFDFGRMQQRISCLQHRPGYNCQKEDFHRYEKGALVGTCDLQREFSLDRFPRDHLRDMFDGFTPITEPLSFTEEVGEQTLFVTRENTEYANLFHALSDLLNAFSTMYMLGLDPSLTRVVLLDEHAAGPYDVWWEKAFSKAAPMVRASSFDRKKILFKEAYFVPPGYSNLLLAHDNALHNCDQQLDLLAAFRSYMLQATGVHPHVPPGIECVRDGKVVKQSEPFGCWGDDLAGEALVVSFIVRRPYDLFVEHSFMGRKISNEAELLLSIQTHFDRLHAAGDCPEVRLVMVDMAQLSAEMQMALIARTDLLVGMHGAGLAHTLFLPSHAGLLEILPIPNGNFWTCHQFIAGWRSLVRRRWANPDESRFVQNAKGDSTDLNAKSVASQIEEMLMEVAHRRQERLLVRQVDKQQ